jgi:hypothetical protein
MKNYSVLEFDNGISLLPNAKPEDVELFLAQKRKEFLERCLANKDLSSVDIMIGGEAVSGNCKLCKESRERLREMAFGLMREEIQELTKILEKYGA